VVPIDVQSDAASLQHIIDDSGVDIIFTTTALSIRLKDYKGAVYCFDADVNDERRWVTESSSTSATLPTITSDTLALLIYTSGTTGRPKGVPLEHGKVAHSLNALFALKIVKPDDIVLLPLPMHHIYPIVIGVFYVTAMGLEVILPAEVTGPAMARAIREGNVTAIMGVPRLYSAIQSGIISRAKASGVIKYGIFQALINICIFCRKYLGLRLGKVLLRPIHRTLGEKIRIAASAGSKLDADLAWFLEGLGWDVGIGYGLTETAPLLSFTIPGDGHVDGVGKPVPNVEIRIDTSLNLGEGRGLPDGVGPCGEVIAKGPNIFSGYWNLPEKNGEIFTSDGWFRTGDLGYLDKGGHLHILGRASTLIVAPGGEKIQPEDVETVYQLHPHLAEVAIFQRDHHLVAIVVPNNQAIHADGRAEIEWAIRSALAEQSRKLASYQRITDFALTRESLPRTRLGKLRRHLLAGIYDSAKGDATSKGAPAKIDEMSTEDKNLLLNPLARIVWDWLGVAYPNKGLTLDTSPQLDLGVDSLEWLNISSEIARRIEVDLPQDAFGRIETIRDLLQEILKAESVGSKEAEALPFENPERFLNDQQRRWLEPVKPIAGPLRWLLEGLNRTLAKLFFKIQLIGTENVPIKGPYVICPNHISHLDPFAVGAGLSHRHFKDLFWGGWQGVVMLNWLNRFICRLSQTIPIDPHNGAVSSLAVGAAVLKRGHGLVWFPEGRRSPEGVLQSFRPGIGLLLEHFQVPVIPVFIKGTFEAMPRGKYIPRLGKVTVIYGKPMTFEELAAKGKGDTLAARITDGLHTTVKEMGEMGE
ncbi:MAG: long-chain fatty acid--CoA ligase, partial [Nitrosomonas sp.]